MFNKKYFTLFLAAVFFLVGGASAFAQTAPMSGKVELKKADGTTEPVAGATVEVFRTDIKGKLPSGKTNKKGEFSFAGLPLGSTLVFSVSGPGIAPEIRPNIRPGAVGSLVITVNPGDGKKWTEEEVRKAVAGGGQSGATTSNTASADSGKLTEEQKKAQEERAKLEAEVNAKNKKIEEANVTIQKALAEGNQAYNSRNFDLAVVKFEEGYQASPDFVGSAPVLLNNKGAALRSRAVITYNENVKATDVTVKVAAMTKVKQDLADAVEAYSKSWAVLKSAPAADITDQKSYESTKIETLRGAKEALRLMAATEQVDTTKTDMAKSLIAEYITLETEQPKKVEGQRILGDIYRVVGDSDNAIIEYKKVLEIEPNDPDALAGLGLSLVNLGYINNDKTKFQEGSNFLQKYIDTAPTGHKYVDDAKGLIATLKKEQSVAPQKTSGGGKKKN
jgi:tetratricopeptide (TPR) repeat protein